jgi:hypothetical protein
MKPETISHWALCALLGLAAVALMAGAAMTNLPSHVASPLSAATLRGGHYQLSSSGGGGSQPGAALLRGGHYRLSGQPQVERLLASGSRYHLRALASPQLTGDGCCCAYLPCIRR